ncbi:SigE family RNA polymerase sigma factor [Spongisporangium articulatum]|uniref:SigE family RNA polymerase sigma factor n=1 Tax=Spongisporangium articulatum TaxID=3362603 RepID=A0ABW8AU30_9ACTN
MTTNGDGSPSAEDFVAERGDALLRLAWLLTGERSAAEDLAQEALARVLPRWDSIGPGRHEAYLRRAIRSTWVDGLRRRAARVRLDVVPDLPDVAQPGDSGAQVDDRLALRAALAALTVRQRTVLVLRYFEDLSEAETARLMGCSVSTVKSTTHDALARLRAEERVTR